MNNLKLIRAHLGQTQQVIADGIGCTQANIGHYERGQTLPPDMAKKLIEFCGKNFGYVISFDHVYGAAKLPEFNAGADNATRTM